MSVASTNLSLDSSRSDTPTLVGMRGRKGKGKNKYKNNRLQYKYRGHLKVRFILSKTSVCINISTNLYIFPNLYIGQLDHI